MMIIKFNKNFYNSSAVKSAIKSYQGLADFSLKENQKFITVYLKNIDRNFKYIIKDEFCNFVLGETIKWREKL